MVDSKQLEMCDKLGLPERPDLVGLVQRKFAHTGAHTLRDVDMCRGICRDIVEGFLSQRKIAGKWSVSRNTINRIWCVMLERGEVEPIVQQVVTLIDRFTVAGLQRLVDAVLDDEIHPRDLPIEVSMLLDKKSQLLAGMVLGTGRTQEEVKSSDVVAMLERMRRAQVTAVESVSGVAAGIIEVSASAAGADTVSATAPGLSEPGGSPALAAGHGAGGGVATFAAGAGGEGLGSEISTSKELL